MTAQEHEGIGDVAGQALPAGTEGGFALLRARLIVIVAHQRHPAGGAEEVEPLVRLVGPAAAEQVVGGADILVAVDAGPDVELQRTVEFGHLDHRIGDDQGLAQFLVLGFEEAPPAIVEAVHLVVGSEEVGFTPDDLLFAETHGDALAEIEFTIELANLDPVVIAEDLVLRAVGRVAQAFEPAEIVGLDLLDRAQLAEEAQRPEHQAGVETQLGTNHAEVVGVVFRCLGDVLQIHRDILAQIAMHADVGNFPGIIGVRLTRQQGTDHERCTGQAEIPESPHIPFSRFPDMPVAPARDAAPIAPPASAGGGSAPA